MVGPPFALEFDFFFAIAAFILDIENGSHRCIDPLAGDLDVGRLVILNAIGEPPKLGDEC